MESNSSEPRTTTKAKESKSVNGGQPKHCASPKQKTLFGSCRPKSLCQIQSTVAMPNKALVPTASRRHSSALELISNMYATLFHPTTKGRVNRTTYLAYTFLYSLVVIAIAVFIWNIWPNISKFSNPVILVMWIVYCASIAVRRAHDIGRNGWFALLALVPVANLILFFRPGTVGENVFGQQPQQSHLGLKVVAVASFTPFVFGLVFLFPHDRTADVWQAYCNIPEHSQWNSKTFQNGEQCWEESKIHLDEYAGGNARHNVGCKLVKTSFPWSLVLNLTGDRE